MKVNAKRHLEAVIKERDDWKAQCLKASEERDTWSRRCQEMATGIVPVLDLIDPALTGKDASARAGREMQASMRMVPRLREGGG